MNNDVVDNNLDISIKNSHSLDTFEEVYAIPKCTDSFIVPESANSFVIPESGQQISGNLALLLGEKGQNREKTRRCQIRAKNDLEAIQCWLKEYQHKKTTYLSYKKESERLLLWCLYQKQKALSDLDVDDIKSYFRFLLNPSPTEKWCCKKGYQRVGRADSRWRPFLGPLSLGSQKTAIAIINSLFNYLQDASYIASNPIRLIKQYQSKFSDNKVAKFKVWERILEQDEWEQMLITLEEMPANSNKEKAKKEKTVFLVALLYLLGLRIFEVASHCWNAFRQTNGKWWFYVLGKGDKEARIPVTEELLAYVKRYRNYLGKESLPQLDETESLILSYHTKKSLSVRQLYRLIKDLGQQTAQQDIFKDDKNKQEKLNKFSPHWIRHLSASHQDKAGIPLKHIKANHRHESEMTTYNYIHSEEDERHDEMQKLHFGLNVNNNNDNLNEKITNNESEIKKESSESKQPTENVYNLYLEIENKNIDKTTTFKLIQAIENTVFRNLEFRQINSEQKKSIFKFNYELKFINLYLNFNPKELLAQIEKDILFEASLRNFDMCYINLSNYTI